jgi:hypothetical protein
LLKGAIIMPETNTGVTRFRVDNWVEAGLARRRSLADNQAVEQDDADETSGNRWTMMCIGGGCFLLALMALGPILGIQ